MGDVENLANFSKTCTSCSLYEVQEISRELVTFRVRSPGSRCAIGSKTNPLRKPSPPTRRMMWPELSSWDTLGAPRQCERKVEKMRCPPFRTTLWAESESFRPGSSPGKGCLQRGLSLVSRFQQPKVRKSWNYHRQNAQGFWYAVISLSTESDYCWPL